MFREKRNLLKKTLINQNFFLLLSVDTHNLAPTLALFGPYHPRLKLRLIYTGYKVDINGISSMYGIDSCEVWQIH